MLSRPYVDGQWVDDERFFTDTRVVDRNPSNGDVIARLPVPNEALAENAMQAAHDAFLDWRHLSCLERRYYLLRLADALADLSDELVPVIQRETGILKPRAEEEVSHGVEMLRESVSHTEVLETRLVEQPGLPEARIHPTPFGVVVWVKSWNSPIAALCKIGSALFAGNTVVLKVSDHAPLCACYFSLAVRNAGFPPGVINVLWDRGGELVEALLTHPLLGKCAFTGSPETGKKILGLLTKKRIRPSFLEVGGGGVQVIFDDADIDEIFPHVFWGAFILSGQICCAGSRVFVQRENFTQVVEYLIGSIQSLNVGPAEDPDTTLGPLISRDATVRFNDVLDRAREEGAEVLSGQQRLPESGFYAAPAVIVSDELNGGWMTEEIFGPAVAVAPFDTRAQILEYLESQDFGLAMSLYTKDMEWIDRNIPEITSGTIWINGYYQSSVCVPFGGAKGSGYGREKGREGVQEFLQPKVVCLPM